MILAKIKRRAQIYLELSKMRIAFFCVIMTAGGILLAPGKISLGAFLMTLLGTTLTVASANTFNMIYEKETDKFMRRTKFRPLPTGRLGVFHAFLFGVAVGILGVALLAIFVNALTAVLSLLAILWYSLVYTPLKTKTPLALVIGAIPGAIPPLLGWTAVSNEVSWAGLALFLVLFAWQMPHFIAISIYHQADYTQAGIRVVSAVRGQTIAKVQAALWTVALIVFSVLVFSFQLGGVFYLVSASCLGLWYLYLGLQGFFKSKQQNWPRRFFLASLVYLPALILGLLVDKSISCWFL